MKMKLKMESRQRQRRTNNERLKFQQQQQQQQQHKNRNIGNNFVSSIKPPSPSFRVVVWIVAFCLLQVVLWIYTSTSSTTGPDAAEHSSSSSSITTTRTSSQSSSPGPTTTTTRTTASSSSSFSSNEFRQWQQDQRRKRRKERREEQRSQEIQQKLSERFPQQYPAANNDKDEDDGEDDDDAGDTTVVSTEIGVQERKQQKETEQEEEGGWMDEAVTPQLMYPVRTIERYIDNDTRNKQNPKKTKQKLKKTKTKTQKTKKNTKYDTSRQGRKSPTMNTRDNNEEDDNDDGDDDVNDDDKIEGKDKIEDDESDDDDEEEGIEDTTADRAVSSRDRNSSSRNTIIRGQQKPKSKPKRNKRGEILHHFDSTTTTTTTTTKNSNKKKDSNKKKGTYYPTTREEDLSEQRFDGYFKDPNVTIADWDYFPKLPRRVQELPPSTAYVRPDDWYDMYNILLSPTQRHLLDFDPGPSYSPKNDNNNGDGDGDDQQRQRHQQQCLDFLKIIDTSPPPLPTESATTQHNNSCDGYDGVLHIKHYDNGAASGTAFFQFTIGMLQWADQHNYLPWIHIDDGTTKPIWDDVVHTQPRPRIGRTSEATTMTTTTSVSSQISFQMKTGVKIGWAIDKRDSWFSMFPGKPELVARRRKNKYNDQRYIRGKNMMEGEDDETSQQLETKEYVVSGTGVWEHYFMPPVQNGFIPGDESCRDKPLVKFDFDHITPGIHANAPWAPRAWRTAEAPYIVQRGTSWDDWFSDQRRHASEIVERYIRFNPYMERRALCAFPNPEFSLGMHIRHGDKYIERKVIEVDKFYQYAKAFVKNGGGAIYVATDSAKVFDIIDTEWPSFVSSHVVRQPSTKGLTRNETAAFDLGVSAHRTNVEALTDLLALSKCTFFLHGLSALSEAVLYINPGLVNRSINLEIEDHDYMTPQYFVDHMMPMGSITKPRTSIDERRSQE